MAQGMKYMKDCTPEILEEIADKIAGGASYYSIEKEYGYSRATIRQWWNARTDKERQRAALNNTTRKKEVMQLAFGTTDVATIDINAKIDTAFEKALEELIYRFTSENAKSVSDKDLISATKLFWEMKRDRQEEAPRTQNNTQNIINIFSDAIEDTIKQQGYE